MRCESLPRSIYEFGHRTRFFYSLNSFTMLSNNFRVVRAGHVDIDSVRIEIHYLHIGGVDEVVATGQYNIRTNWAHVIRLEDYEDFLSSDWEDEMVEAIESRSIEID